MLPGTAPGSQITLILQRYGAQVCNIRVIGQWGVDFRWFTVQNDGFHSMTYCERHARQTPANQAVAPQASRAKALRFVGGMVAGTAPGSRITLILQRYGAKVCNIRVI